MTTLPSHAKTSPKSVAAICYMADGCTGVTLFVVRHVVTSGEAKAAVRHISNAPIVSCELAGNCAHARIHHTGDRCVLARSSALGVEVVTRRGTAPIGANHSRETSAILGPGAAVAGACSVAIDVRAHLESIFAENGGVTCCRGQPGVGRAVDDDASEDEDHGVRADDHTEIRREYGLW